MEELKWIKAGSYAINAGCVYWINTAAKWMREPDGDAQRDAWNEVRPDILVERSGVEVFLFIPGDKTLRFVDGSPEAEEPKRFVESNSLKS